MYPATVFKVMIASPSDVSEERENARKAVYQWSGENAQSTSIVLLPVSWETDSAPVMGAPPQEIINRQILADCDYLIGIFGTRFGTPTAEFTSGTAEEINKHIAAGKPTSIFMLKGSVLLGGIDTKQLDALRKFEDSIRNKGLIGEYNDAAHLKEQIRKSLGTIVRENYFQTRIGEAATNVGISAIVESRPLDSLSQEAQELILVAASDGLMKGSIVKTAKLFRDFWEIKAGDQTYKPDGSRSYYMNALDDELLPKGFVSFVKTEWIQAPDLDSIFGKGIVVRYELTAKAFQAVSRLRKKSAE